MPIALPDLALVDYKYKNMSAEAIYYALPQNIEKYFTLDTHLEPSCDSDNWDDMEDKIMGAYEASKDFYESSNYHGRLPAGIARIVNSIKKEKVPWERILLRYAGEALSREDFSYTKLNRRHLANDIYLPALNSTTVGLLVLVFDTSASISEKLIEQFLGELKKLSYLIDQVIVMTCDAAVHEVIRIHKMENIANKIEFKGRGGTDFNPVFIKIKEMKVDPDLVIYLTDTFGTFPEKHPPYPVLWCITDPNGSVPWGSSVYLPQDAAERW